MDEEALLALIYRGRPATMAELSAMSHLTEAEADEVADRLGASGLLDRRGEQLTYRHPAEWVAGEVAADLDGARRATRDSLARVERLVERLPDLLRQWAVGEAASDIVPVLTRHGPNAAWDLWYDNARQGSPAADAVFPSADRFLSTSPERRVLFSEAFARKQSVRAILPTGAMDDPALREMATHYAAAGVQFRTLDDPPSWFWIDGDMLAIPFEWGEGWPTSVLGLRNASLADVARALFEELWRRAEPVGQAAQPWTPLLRLMRSGVTLDAASRTLGVNPRTGRRRVAAAMQHYGVSTLFALGVAWGADIDG